MRPVFSPSVASVRARLIGAHLWTTGVGCAAFTLVAVPSVRASEAANRIDAIEVHGTELNAEIAIRAPVGRDKIEFSLFRLTNPTRVVVDLPQHDVSNVSVPSRFDASSLVSGVTTTQFRGRNGTVGRVVFAMRGDVEVSTRSEDGAVLIHARRESVGAPAAGRGAVRAEERSSQVASDAASVIELRGEGTPAAAARRVVGVEGRQQADGSLVQIRTDGEVTRYEVEEAANPPRLIVDLYGVSLASSADRTFTDTAIRRARTWEHADHVRVVLDAREALPTYNVASTGEGLTVLFKDGSSATKAPRAASLGALSLDEKAGFWRLRANLGSPVSVRTLKNAPDEKVIALDGVRVAEAALGARRLVGGPVRDVVVSRDEQRPDSLRLKLLLDGEVEHSVWQRDGVLSWDVRRAGTPGATSTQVAERTQPAAAPFSTAPVTLLQEGAAAATYKGKKITIDLQDADIVNIIRLIGDVSGKNVVVGDEVRGKVTLKLKNVPWDQAFDIILKTKELGHETKGGIIRVVSQAKLDAEREARLRLQDEREKKLPTTVRIIPVNYAVASEMQAQVAGLLSARGKVTIDDRTNVIIVEDIRENLDQAERLVRTLDTQTPQVLIEARMVEGSAQFARSLGIQWGGGFFLSQRGGNPTGLMFPSNIGIVGAADGAGATSGVVFPPNFAVNLPSQQGATTAIGLNLGSVGNFGFVNARLTAAETSGQARIISSPRITTLNNKRARITQGTDISIPISTQNTVSVQTVRAALNLDVLPHVTADGSILMTINVTNNAPGAAVGGGPPPINTKEAQTEMLIRDGDTAVIGGIYTRQNSETMQQTPVLGSIPILGWLFKTVAEQDSRSEMLVFITPRVMNPGSIVPNASSIGGQ